jgi:hypothetical protein
MVVPGLRNGLIPQPFRHGTPLARWVGRGRWIRVVSFDNALGDGRGSDDEA